MATKPLTNAAIALTEKKMDMTLDDIIKMSKSNTSKIKKQRVSNRSQNFLTNASQNKSSKVQWFMDSRSSLRQGVLAQKRSNFQGNHFPLAAAAARKAVAAPIHNRSFNHSRMVNFNKPRVGAPPIQRNAAGSGFAVKSQKQQVKVIPKQRPQTLDSLFANMKEQRMRIFSQQNDGRQNSGGQQRLHRGRGRFGK